VPDVLLERLEDGGVLLGARTRSAEPPVPLSPADRPGERIALSLRDPPLQVQVSDDVRQSEVVHPPRVRPRL